MENARGTEKIPALGFGCAVQAAETVSRMLRITFRPTNSSISVCSEASLMTSVPGVVCMSPACCSAKNEESATEIVRAYLDIFAQSRTIFPILRSSLRRRDLELSVTWTGRRDTGPLTTKNLSGESPFQQPMLDSGLQREMGEFPHHTVSIPVFFKL